MTSQNVHTFFTSAPAKSSPTSISPVQSNSVFHLNIAVQRGIMNRGRIQERTQGANRVTVTINKCFTSEDLQLFYNLAQGWNQLPSSPATAALARSPLQKSRFLVLQGLCTIPSHVVPRPAALASRCKCRFRHLSPFIQRKPGGCLSTRC